MEVDARFLIINKNSNLINEKQRTTNNALPEVKAEHWEIGCILTTQLILGRVGLIIL